MFYPYEGYRSVTPLDVGRVIYIFFYKKLKNVSCEYNREWLKLNFASCFASCVVHQTRSYIE